MIKSKFQINDYIEFKKKRLARVAVRNAIKKNELTRAPFCELCKIEAKTNAHHIDYGRPLNVMWLCDACHGVVHTKAHPFNPKNNKQSPNSLIWNASDTITVSFNIPIKQYMLIKKKSHRSKKKLSRILREGIEKIYPLETQQLEFDFEKAKNDRSTEALQLSSSELKQRIRSMDKDENSMLQPKVFSVSLLRGERNKNLPRMEEQFFDFFTRHGADAGRLPRANTN